MGRHLLFTLLAAGTASTCLFGRGIGVANKDLLSELDARDQAVLKEHGIVGHTTDWKQIHEVYEDAADRDLPVFVTVDPFLHAFHVIFDNALLAVEQDEFYPAVQQMLKLLLSHQQGLLATEDDPTVRASLQGNIAYLSVPLALLDSGFKVPAAVAESVHKELAHIEVHQGGAISATMGYEEDFSQYKPRGHYTKNTRLRRYFKAMMYLGRMTFRLDSSALGVDFTRRAILLASSFKVPGPDDVTPAQLWKDVYEPTAWLVGESDDLVPHEYDSLFTALANGAELSAWVASDDSILRFVTAAQSLRGPAILSDIVLGGLPKGMRLMGQRYIPDSHVFHNLTHDRIPDRTLPMGLDVMAVLGSDRAREHLINIYHQDKFHGYLAKLDSMRQVFDAFTAEDWHRNIYYGWLHVLKLNLEPVVRPTRRSLVAKFTQSPAYADKTLVTTCGSWTELRHDTILYAKQSYATSSRRIVRPHREVAYVEPKPAVFDRVAGLASELRRLTAAIGEADEKLGRLITAATRLAEIASSELAGKEMAEEDGSYCRTIGGELRRMTDFSSAFMTRYCGESKPVPPETEPRFIADSDQLEEVRTYGKKVEYGYARPDGMALVADVHTDPNLESRLVLEEAVGDPVRLYAVIPFYGKQYLAVGACFSYYEFTRPMSERMTDEEWRALDPKPPMPVWTKSFITR